MNDEKGNTVSVKTYPYIGGSFDRIHFKGDDSWWVKERTCTIKVIYTEPWLWSECSACSEGSEDSAWLSANYCPNCGAKVVAE